MANTNPLKYDKTLQLRVDQAFLDMIDALRSTRRPIPTRCALIREAVDLMAKRQPNPQR